MDKITKINSGEKFTHTSVGKLAEFNGKQFLKDTVGTTGCEISFGTIEPGQAAPFFHSHKQNEEIYIILSGAGDIQVNDTDFPIDEGSIVRVATACNRSIRCTSTEKMLTSAFRQKKVVSNNVLWRTVKSPNKKQNGSKTRRLFYVIQEQPPLTS